MATVAKGGQKLKTRENEKTQGWIRTLQALVESYKALQRALFAFMANLLTPHAMDFQLFVKSQLEYFCYRLQLHTLLNTVLGWFTKATNYQG